MTTIELICHIPEELRRENSTSPRQLVRESGYMQHPEMVTLDALEVVLRVSPELVQDWLIYSSDKRSDSGWYFQEVKLTDHHKYIVGNIPDGETLIFFDPIKACCHFIVEEIAHISRNAA